MISGMPNRYLPLIADIKRHSLEDGPGIRSVVFFKGCPLRCIFCQNPEAQDPKAEIAFSSRECIRCGKCAEVCSQGAVDLETPSRIHREKCIRCGMCAEACPGRGLRRIGTFYPVETLAELLLRDLPFYRHSGGGVTLSGGECTLYPYYLESLLKILKARGVHVVLETSGDFEYVIFREKVLPFIDMIYYDVKFADSRAYRQYTGRSNQRIIENFLCLLREGGVTVHPRIPVIPGITATRENFSGIVGFLCEAGAENVSLLPYNPMGFEMAVSLGRPRSILPDGFMKREEEREVYNLFKMILAEKRDSGRGIFLYE